MEKRPILTRDSWGFLTGQSCYNFCKFVSEDYEMRGERELAIKWLAEATSFKNEIDLGLLSYNKNPLIEKELAKDKDAWEAVTLTWADRYKQWDKDQRESTNKRMERQIEREKQDAA
jgi:hypothetical protein